MNHAYETDKIASAYKEFLASEDGQIFQKIIGKTVLEQIMQAKELPFSVIPTEVGIHEKLEKSQLTIKITKGIDSGQPALPDSLVASGMTERERGKPIEILDAGCGNGWLTDHLQKNIPNSHVQGCDAGNAIIEEAKKTYPESTFQVADLNKPLPYPAQSFDIITASMVLHDVDDESTVLKNLAKILKADGRLIATIVNPYYGFPVGAWKRGFWGRLLNKLPKLKLVQNYNLLARNPNKNFEWRPALGSNFTPFSKHIQSAKMAGLILTDLIDLNSETDSPTYNLTYQLYRFPIILMLEFRKLK